MEDKKAGAPVAEESLPEAQPGTAGLGHIATAEVCYKDFAMPLLQGKKLILQEIVCKHCMHALHACKDRCKCTCRGLLMQSFREA